MLTTKHKWHSKPEKPLLINLLKTVFTKTLLKCPLVAPVC